MATAFVATFDSPPLALPCSYDPTFKVDVRTHEPLWEGTLSTGDVAVEVMTLCAELEPFIAAQLSKESEPTTSPTSRGPRKRNYSNTFETHANLLVDKMNKCLQNLPSRTPVMLQDYILHTGLDTLYPRASRYISTSYLPTHQSHKSPMDGYFTHLSIMNQISVMCQQLRHDATHLTNHKYIAHQIALLYQSLNQLGNVSSIQAYKTNIETTFKKVKIALTPNEAAGDQVPRLPTEYLQWLVELTSALQHLVTSLTMEINHPLLPAIAFLQQKQ